MRAFQFENNLQSLKRLVRGGRNPLSQLWKRVGEYTRVRVDGHSNSCQLVVGTARFY